MAVKYHGVWQIYVPDLSRPDELSDIVKNAPSKTVHCRNEAGENWYDYQKKLGRETTKVTIDPATRRVLMAHDDTSMVWPANAQLLELDTHMDYETQLKFRVFNFDTEQFEDDGFLAALLER